MLKSVSFSIDWKSIDFFLVVLCGHGNTFTVDIFHSKVHCLWFWPQWWMSIGFFFVCFVVYSSCFVMPMALPFWSFFICGILHYNFLLFMISQRGFFPSIYINFPNCIWNMFNESELAIAILFIEFLWCLSWIECCTSFSFVFFSLYVSYIEVHFKCHCTVGSIFTSNSIDTVNQYNH